MTKYTLAQLQHMAAIQTPLPAAYYDAAEVAALLAPKGQEDRARELWQELYSWLSSVPECEDRREAILSVIAAALAQAREEGIAVGHGRAMEDIGALTAAADAAGCRRGVEQYREKAFEPFSRLEYIGRMTLWQQLRDTAASLLSAPEAAGWHCKARASSVDPPQDCDWPHCGCDPHAEKVVSALIEEGWASPEAGDRHRTLRTPPPRNHWIGGPLREGGPCENR